MTKPDIVTSIVTKTALAVVCCLVSIAASAHGQQNNEKAPAVVDASSGRPGSTTAEDAAAKNGVTGPSNKYDIVIVGGTPGGIMAAIGAAREGRDVVLLCREKHVGGLPANGLGATDITTRGATQGLFLEFVHRIKKFYVDTYGPDSDQVSACRNGYYFESSVAEKVLLGMLAEYSDKVQVLLLRQFDAMPERILLGDNRIRKIAVVNRETQRLEYYSGEVFIDATYEGDLAAAAGAPFRVGREGMAEYNEPRAGRLYAYYEAQYVGAQPGKGSTGLGDNAIQAYNYRICLTKDPDLRIPITKPDSYDRREFAPLLDEIKHNRRTMPPGHERLLKGIGWVVANSKIPNRKTSSNHQAASFLGTDLAEENWPWPTSSWDWRDRYAQRLRSYTLGLLWFVQNDPEVPPAIRTSAIQWGLAKGEYEDNGNFPRQVYVREGRRIMGEYLFTAHDALSMEGIGGQMRPPIHAESITSSHYHLDSHATRKREPGRIALEGFFSLKATKPYTVPYGVIVPKKIDGLLTPVPVSGTHIGFSTLRMEPCWMALGQAAGIAASLAIETNLTPREIDIVDLQRKLVSQNAMLIYFEDLVPENPHFEAVQFFALRGFFPPDRWQARVDEPVSEQLVKDWKRVLSFDFKAAHVPGETTLGEILDSMFRHVLNLPAEDRSSLRGPYQVAVAH